MVRQARIVSGFGKADLQAVADFQNGWDDLEDLVGDDDHTQRGIVPGDRDEIQRQSSTPRTTDRRHLAGADWLSAPDDDSCE